MAESEYAARVAVAMKAAAYYRGITTDELAESVGVSVETVRRWMRASTGMSAEDAARVAEALDVPSDLLLRPPASRELALAMVAAYDQVRASTADDERPS